MKCYNVSDQSEFCIKELEINANDGESIKAIAKRMQEIAYFDAAENARLGFDLATRIYGISSRDRISNNLLNPDNKYFIGNLNSFVSENNFDYFAKVQLDRGQILRKKYNNLSIFRAANTDPNGLILAAMAHYSLSNVKGDYLFATYPAKQDFYDTPMSEFQFWHDLGIPSSEARIQHYGSLNFSEIRFGGDSIRNSCITSRQVLELLSEKYAFLGG